MHVIMFRLRTRLREGGAYSPWPMRLARIAWLIMVVLIFGVLLFGLIGYVVYLHVPLAETDADGVRLTARGIQELARLGLSVDSFAGFQVAIHLIYVLVFVATGGLLLLKKSGDRMALFAAFTLPLFAFGFWFPYQGISSQPVELLARWLSFGGSFAFDVFIYVFPDGRFVPRWTRFCMIGWVVNEVHISFNPVMFSQDASPFLNLLTPIMLLTVLVAQVYRYRRASTPVQRHQTKWVLFGIVVGVAGFGGIAAVVALTGSSVFMPGTLAYFLALTGMFLFPLFIPVSIGFAILHSRLWDIDVVIKRTLVYGTLTGALALAYWAVIAGLQAVLRPIAGEGNDLAVVASTLVIAALFLPLRRLIQAFIDRRFYRRKYDAARTLASFGQVARDEVNLEALTGRLLGVVQETMQPEHVSLWVSEPVRSGSTAARAGEGKR